MMCFRLPMDMAVWGLEYDSIGLRIRLRRVTDMTP